jgi:hypothetical protein
MQFFFFSIFSYMGDFVPVEPLDKILRPLRERQPGLIQPAAQLPRPAFQF